MKEKQKNYEKGITLIALVITIIVLLILAGVTLRIVMNGGIINKSQTAVDKYTEESAREKLSLAIFNYKMGVITGEAGEIEGKKHLNEYIEEIGGTILEETSDSYIIELDKYEFSVKKDNYEITSLGEVTGEKPSITKSEVILSNDKKSATIKVTVSAVKGGTLTVTIGGKETTLENGTYNLTVTNNDTYTIIVAEEGTTRKAIGTIEVSGIEKTKYTVTINKGTGIESATASQQVEEGNSIKIEAKVQTGYEFIKWKVTSGNESDVVNVTSATTTVTPTGNITIEATADEQAILSNINGSTNAKVGSGNFSYNNPVIPVGFKTSNEGASWSLSADGTYVTGWNDGLVIQDGSGNQFVWVPVDGTNVKYDYHYSIGSQGSISLEQSLPSGITNENTQITTYKGFYIARYEAGIPETLTSAISNTLARDTSGIPVSKKNQVPWNYISWSQAKANAESMYKLTNTNNHVQSTLITDRMWETTMQWLEKANINVASDSRSWGNYNNAEVTEIMEYSVQGGTNWTIISSSTKENNTDWLLKTGHTDYTSRKNIYDLAGNLWEWTNAKHDSITSEYTNRGGYYGNDGMHNPAAYRYGRTDKYDTFVGFRVALFVQ